MLCLWKCFVQRGARRSEPPKSRRPTSEPTTSWLQIPIKTPSTCRLQSTDLNHGPSLDKDQKRLHGQTRRRPLAMSVANVMIRRPLLAMKYTAIVMPRLYHHHAPRGSFIGRCSQCKPALTPHYNNGHGRRLVLLSLTTNMASVQAQAAAITSNINATSPQEWA